LLGGRCFGPERRVLCLLFLFGRLRKGQNAPAGEFIRRHILIAECRRAFPKQISGSVVG